MSGHVHEAEMHVADGQVGEADVNRDAALFFFLEAVGVHARERAHERRLAVIYVPGCADDDSFHPLVCFPCCCRLCPRVSPPRRGFRLSQAAMVCQSARRKPRE
jgi:hypothetical protein